MGGRSTLRKADLLVDQGDMIRERTANGRPNFFTRVNVGDRTYALLLTALGGAVLIVAGLIVFVLWQSAHTALATHPLEFINGLGSGSAFLRSPGVHLWNPGHQRAFDYRRGPGCPGVSDISGGDCAERDETAGLLPARAAGRNPECGLWIVGPFRNGAVAARAARAIPGRGLRLSSALPGAPSGARVPRRRTDSRGDDSTDHRLGLDRSPQEGAGLFEGGIPRAGRHQVGNGTHRLTSLQPSGHHGSDHPGPGPRAGRDDGSDDGDRQLP